MPAVKLKQYLDEHKIKYLVIHHSPAYTAQEVAEAAHISGKEMAKAVIVKIDGNLAMVVVPATTPVKFHALQNELGVEKLELASESEFMSHFPGCEVGAIPPFGHLYDFNIYVDKQLASEAQIAFNAGNYSEVIQMAYTDYFRLVQPQVVNMGT